MLNAVQMRLLPQCFKSIPDPLAQELKAHCRRQGRRHRLSAVLSIAAGAILCGMQCAYYSCASGYKAISNWADNLGQQARARFDCQLVNGRYIVPSESVIRDCLVRIEPGTLDGGLNAWNQAWGAQDKALAIDGKTIDGKTMKNALDEEGRQVHIMSAVGHESKRSYAQKK